MDKLAGALHHGIPEILGCIKGDQEFLINADSCKNNIGLGFDKEVQNWILKLSAIIRMMQ